MSHQQDSHPGGPDSIDKRLHRLFSSLETHPGFEAEVLARIRAEAHFSAQRSRSAAVREQQFYQESVGGLRRWRRTALRMLTLDALAASAVLMVFIVGLLRSQADFLGWIQSFAFVISASSSSVLVWASLLGVAIGLAPLIVLRARA